MEVNNLHHSKNISISNGTNHKEAIYERPTRLYKKFTKYDVKYLKNYLAKKFKHSSTVKYRNNILKPRQNVILHRKNHSIENGNNQRINYFSVNLPEFDEKEEFDVNKLKTVINNLKKIYIKKYAIYFYELVNKIKIISYLKNINNQNYNNSNNRGNSSNNSFYSDQIDKPIKNSIKKIYKHKTTNKNNKQILLTLIKKKTYPKYQMSNNIINFSIIRNKNINIREKISKLIQLVRVIYIKNSQIMEKLKNSFNDIKMNLSKSYSTFFYKPEKNENILSQSFSSASSNKTQNIPKSKSKKVLKITYRNIILDKNGSITKVIEKNERRVILTDQRNSAISFVKKLIKILDKRSKIIFFNYLQMHKNMDKEYRFEDPIDSESETFLCLDEKIEEFRIKLISCFLKTRNVDIDD